MLQLTKHTCLVFLLSSIEGKTNTTYNSTYIDNSLNGGKIAGWTLAAIFLLTSVVLSIIYASKQFGIFKVTSGGTAIENPRWKREEDEETLCSMDRLDITGKEANYSLQIQVQNLAAFLKEKEEHQEAFKAEYENIPRRWNLPMTSGARPEVSKRNRFKDILPYDHSRVFLSVIEEHDHSDYINASYIKGYRHDKAFIAAQGPKDLTIDDFWRMVWEQEVTIVVMVTNLCEAGRMKCACYWPERRCTQTYGQIEVTHIHEQKLQDYTIRKLKMYKDSTQRMVKQFHFTSWPDHGVPEQPTGLLAFHRNFLADSARGSAPVLVHCSAGVGRTGTLIALDILLQQAEEEGVVDVPGVVNRMRECRTHMVQSLIQYEFIYQALLEALTVGQTSIPCYKFDRVCNRFCESDPKTSQTKIQAQYQMLETRKPRASETNFRAAILPDNLDKNRSIDFLPLDMRRCILMTPVESSTDYINAVWTQGYKNKSAFIATQAPMAITRVDFWRLVYDYKCNTVVMLCPLSSLQDDDVYTPSEDGILSLAPFDVYVEAQYPQEGYTTTDLTLSYKDIEHSVRHLVVTCDLSEVPPDRLIQLLLDICGQAQESQQLSTDQPIVVHCLEGIEWTGLYCAIHYLCDMINGEQQVDVFRVVNEIRQARPQFIPDWSQYRLLYTAVSSYLRRLQSISNWGNP